MRAARARHCCRSVLVHTFIHSAIPGLPTGSSTGQIICRPVTPAGPNVKPPACCHPPSPCEWRPTGGFDAPTLGGRSRRRQRCVGARNLGLWTRLWVGWGRAGVFLWTGRDRDVHADRCRDLTPRVTCADGDPCCGWETHRRIWVGEKVPGMAVHGVVQVSHVGGTVPAWQLRRVQCQRVQ